MKSLWTHRYLPWPLIVLWLAILAGCLLSGCGSLADVDDAIAQAKATQAELRAALAEAQGLTDKQKAGIETALSKTDKALAALEAERERLASENPGDQIAGGAKVVSGLLPPPYGEIVGMIGIIVGGIVGGIYRGKARVATEAVTTMSAAREAGLVTISDTAAAALRALQSDKARALVDSVAEAAKVMAEDVKPLATPHAEPAPKA